VSARSKLFYNVLPQSLANSFHRLLERDKAFQTVNTHLKNKQQILFIL